jgi:ribosome-associated heat shock protein Hsp15
LIQRLDKWLVYARFAKHRSVAVEMIALGYVRINRERAKKPSQTVKCQDVLTITQSGHVRVVRVQATAERRESAATASQLYEDLVLSEKADASIEALC